MTIRRVRSIGRPKKDINAVTIEVPLQKEAYLYYQELGKDRNQKKVAKHIDRAIQTIGKWAVLFDWVERARKYDGKVARVKRRMQMKVLPKEIDKNKNDLQETISALITQFKHEAEAGLIQTKNIVNLERLIKSFMIVTGQATDITEERRILFIDVGSREEVSKRKALKEEGKQGIDNKEAFEFIDFEEVEAEVSS